VSSDANAIHKMGMNTNSRRWHVQLAAMSKYELSTKADTRTESHPFQASSFLFARTGVMLDHASAQRENTELHRLSKASK
jgi:hypothetical protein